MNIEDLFEKNAELNGTILTFPNQRTVTIVPSFRKSVNKEVARYDFGCFDKETLDILLTDPLSIVYDDGDE